MPEHDRPEFIEWAHRAPWPVSQSFPPLPPMTVTEEMINNAPTYR